MLDEFLKCVIFIIGGGIGRISMSITLLLTLLNQIKIFHWQTPKRSEHIALDTLYNELSESIDKIVENFMGKYNTVIKSKDGFTIKLENYSTSEAVIEKLNKFITYLNTKFITDNTNNSDLISIKDEIIISINKYKYLASLK